MKFNLQLDCQDIALIQPSQSFTRDILYIFQDQDVVEQLRTERMTEEVQAGKYIEKLINHNLDPASDRWDYLIFHKSKQRVIGHIGLAKMDIDGYIDQNNIRFFTILHRLMWGEGYATKTSMALMCEVRRTYKILYAHCTSANTNAIDMLHRQNFVFAGEVPFAYGPKLNNASARIFYKKFP